MSEGSHVPKRGVSERQIVDALLAAASGTPVTEVVGRLGVSEQTFHAWKRKYAVVGVVEQRRIRELEDENHKLKDLVADLSLEKQRLQDKLGKKS